MFRVVNYSSNTNEALAKECRSASEIADTVFAITENENEAKKALRIATSMHSGDVYSAKLYRITCVDPSAYPVSAWERSADGAVRCPVCGNEPRGKTHAYEPTPYCLLCGTRMNVGAFTDVVA